MPEVSTQTDSPIHGATSKTPEHTELQLTLMKMHTAAAHTAEELASTTSGDESLQHAAQAYGSRLASQSMAAKAGLPLDAGHEVALDSAREKLANTFNAEAQAALQTSSSHRREEVLASTNNNGLMQPPRDARQKQVKPKRPDASHDQSVQTELPDQYNRGDHRHK